MMKQDECEPFTRNQQQKQRRCELGVRSKIISAVPRSSRNPTEKERKSEESKIVWVLGVVVFFLFFVCLVVVVCLGALVTVSRHKRTQGRGVQAGEEQAQRLD